MDQGRFGSIRIGLNIHISEIYEMVQSQMTEVPDNRMSQMAEFKQTEEVYNIMVFF